MQPIHQIFDRPLKRLQRQKAAKTIRGHDFLLQEVAQRMAERLHGEINSSFPLALELGTRHGYLQSALEKNSTIDNYISAELSGSYDCAAIIDEEWLPIKQGSVNLILSLLNLHWVNDLPGALSQIRMALAEKGLLLATFFGGETLKELRHAATAYEGETTRGISPRVSPFVEVKDAGMLLQRVGFHLPVADSEIITVMYKNADTLMKDLKAMGESNALLSRSKQLTSRGTLEGISRKYSELFAAEDGRLPATFEIITLTGWKN